MPNLVPTFSYELHVENSRFNMVLYLAEALNCITVATNFKSTVVRFHIAQFYEKDD